jgi:outer membrane protein assembly factor BamB
VFEGKWDLTYLLDLDSDEGWSCTSGGWVTDIHRVVPGVYECYWSGRGGWVGVEVCGAQSLWSVRLPEDASLRLGGPLAYALTQETGKLFAVGADTGLLKWVRPVKRQGETGGAYLAAIGAAVVAVKLDSYQSIGPRFALLRASDGAELTSVRATSTHGEASWSAQDGEQWLAIPSGPRVQAFRLGGVSGRPAWDRRLPGTVARLLRTGPRLIAVTGSPRVTLVALDSATGDPAWELLLPPGDWHWEEARDNGRDLFVVRQRGAIQTVVRIGDGRMVWESPAQEGAWLDLAKGTVGRYVAVEQTRNPGPHMEKAILIVDAMSGRVVSRYAFSPDVTFEQVFVHDGTMYLFAVQTERPVPPTHVYGYELQALATAAATKAPRKQGK